jgi:hypothetical protein
MAKSKEQIQDIAFRQMDKTNRQNRNKEEEVLSLAEQLKKREKWDSLSPEEKLRALPREEWLYQMRTWMRAQKQGVGVSHLNWAERKYAKKFEEFHQNGTMFSRIQAWLLEETSSEFMNL